MKVGNVVKIKDIKANSEKDVGKIGIVIKVKKSHYYGNYEGLICYIQTSTETLQYHEGRLEVVNAIH